MSAKTTTAPRPSSVSIGTETQETGRPEASRRTNRVVRIHDPVGLRRRRAHGGVEILRTDPQASQIRQGLGRHAKPPGSIESNFGAPGHVKQRRGFASLRDM
jgi:hypothetical protein